MLLIRKRGDSVWHSPKITAYENELALQTLLRQSPSLLPGMTNRAMVIVDEMAVAAGYIDLVGVDVEAAITLVECKLKANPEIRRQVVGQVLAYAASLWRMSYEQFDQAFAARAGKSLVQAVEALGVESWNEETFRTRVAENLAAGRFRLVIAVDQITDELKAIVLYLNEHTLPEIQVLALELGYIADEGVEILVPASYGEQSIKATKPASSGTAWNEESLFEELGKCCKPEGLRAAQDLVDYLKSHGARLEGGRGNAVSVTAWLPIQGRHLSTLAIGNWAPNKGGVWSVNFGNLIGNGVPREVLARLTERLREIPEIAKELEGLEKADFNKYPSFSIDKTLTPPGRLDIVERALDELYYEASSVTDGLMGIK